MPYDVKKDDRCPASKPWAVVKKDGGKLIGCHTSAAKAHAQIAAIGAQKFGSQPVLDPGTFRRLPVDKSSRGVLTKTIERRSYGVRLEVRAQSDATATIEGYASVFDAPYEMYDMLGAYTEVVRPGAFTRTLNAKPETQLLLNHGGLAMAYTKAGTLRLSEDSTGLHIAADLNTARSDVRDMVAAIGDGNVDEMSFAFRTERQDWSPDYAQRDLLEVSINRGDVSVVNFGASASTSVAMRAQDFDHLDDESALALYARLTARFAPPPGEHPLSLALALAASQG